MTVAARRAGRKRQASSGMMAAVKAADLLAWYDLNRRALPWRAAPGEKPVPYRVWLSEIMLQQTTVKTVERYYPRFLERFPTLQDLAAAPLEEVLKLWAGLGYYARARHLHACARELVARHGGRFPEEEAALLKLPGIGRYTAAAMAAIAFGRPVIPIDGNVERVVTRLFAVEEALPGAKRKIASLAAALVSNDRPGDLAQALMDLGATICTPKSPACSLCPWINACAAHRQGAAESFPRKTPKRGGRLRRGAAFVVLRADGNLLVRTRSPKGLLGGMTEVPTTPWSPRFKIRDALKGAPQLALAPMTDDQITWRRLPGTVFHSFTHFSLELVVYRARVPARTRAPAGMRWLSLAEVEGAAFPSLMRKVVAHGLASPD